MTTAPSQSDLADLLTVVQHIGVNTDQILLKHYGHVIASQKADGTLVTATDRAVDDYITTRLSTAFPDHAILSEERNTHFDATSPFSWVIDPLDGTTNYARGMPIWGVSIALLFQGAPVLGYLRFVSLHEEYHATLNGGTWSGNHKVQSAPEAHTDDEHFITICTRTPRYYQVDTKLKPRILGSAAYHIAAVANGSALAGIESTPKLWDFAAALLILTEAGGSYKRLDQETPLFPLSNETKDYARLSYPLLAAANRSILEEMEKSIAKRPR